MNKSAENGSQQINVGQTFLSNQKEHSSRESRKAWARLIQKVYDVDPLICPKCESKMRIIAIIQDQYELDRILKWLERKKKSSPVLEKAAV